MPTREEIKSALKHMKKEWQMQSNALDSATRFIYSSHSVDDIKTQCEANGADLNYALHRWYNFNCAKTHEEIFLKLGAKKEEDPYHKTIDFYLLDIAFDLKTTYFPKAIVERETYNQNRREDKDRLIRWLYENQSKEGRYHLENRLFIICENLESKSNFNTIEIKVNNFIEYSKHNGLNKIEIEGKTIYSDIIWISDEK